MAKLPFCRVINPHEPKQTHLMRTQFAKFVAALVLVGGLGSVAVKAQPITVTSVGSVRHDGGTQVPVVFSVPVEEASGTNTANYTFTGGVATTGASLMTGLPVANAPDVLINPAPGGRVFDNQCVVLTVTGLASNATTTITVQNVKDRQ